jgi:hypothetical protein
MHLIHYECRAISPLSTAAEQSFIPEVHARIALASTRDTKYTCHTHLLNPLSFTHVHNTSRYVVGDPPPVVSRWNALHQAAYLDRPRIAEAVIDEVNAHFERLKNANPSERSFFDDKHERCLRAFLNDPNGSMPKITSESFGKRGQKGQIQPPPHYSRFIHHTSHTTNATIYCTPPPPQLPQPSLPPPPLTTTTTN